MNWHDSIRDHGYAIVPGVLNARDFDSLIIDITEPEVRRSRACGMP